MCGEEATAKGSNGLCLKRHLKNDYLTMFIMVLPLERVGLEGSSSKVKLLYTEF